MKYEANFFKDKGEFTTIGMSRTVLNVDIDSGEPLPPPEGISGPSSEAVHIGLLAKALDLNDLGLILYSTNEALDILHRKINTYEAFDKKYPGYGGFLPFLTITGTEVKPLGPDWDNMVDAKDNGELFWAIYGLIEILDVRYASHRDLKKRWETVMHKMIDNSVSIFYEGDGKIWSRAKMTDMTKAVSENTYENAQGACDFDH